MQVIIDRIEIEALRAEFTDAATTLPAHPGKLEVHRARLRDQVRRHDAAGPPPAPVRYSLTQRGRSLREQLHALARWADTHSADLPASHADTALPEHVEIAG